MAGSGGGEVEVWRGAVAPWECDAAGRWLARFHLARALEGLVGLAAELGMAEAFAPTAVSTLQVREHHVRFLGEARAGEPAVMTAGVLSLGEDDAQVLQVLERGDGEPLSAIVARLAHVSVREARPFAWSGRIREAAAALAVKAPHFARPSGLAADPPEIDASRERAEALGVPVAGCGAVRPDECDVFGRMRPDAVMGRCEEAAAHLFKTSAGQPLAEARLLYLRAPMAGARLELRSAATGAGDRLAHWLLDPGDGQPWAVALALASGEAREAAKPAGKAARKAPPVEAMGF
jgi:acyl-CoA thioester hydrolase